MNTIEIKVIHKDGSISLKPIYTDTIYTAKLMKIDISKPISFDNFKYLEEVEEYYQ